MAPYRDDEDERVTNGELMRGLKRIEENVVSVNRKVDRQGEAITGVHIRLAQIDTAVGIRLTAIETAQGPSETSRRSTKTVAAGSAGLGAALLGLVQWLITHLGSKGGP